MDDLFSVIIDNIQEVIMDKRYIFFMISVLILAALACNARQHRRSGNDIYRG